MDEPSFDIDDELELQEAMEMEAQMSQDAEEFGFDYPGYQEEMKAVVPTSSVVLETAPSVLVVSYKPIQVVSRPSSFARLLQRLCATII